MNNVASLSSLSSMCILFSERTLDTDMNDIMRKVQLIKALNIDSWTATIFECNAAKTKHIF